MKPTILGPYLAKHSTFGHVHMLKVYEALDQFEAPLRQMAGLEPKQATRGLGAGGLGGPLKVLDGGLGKIRLKQTTRWCGRESEAFQEEVVQQRLDMFEQGVGPWFVGRVFSLPFTRGHQEARVLHVVLGESRAAVSSCGQDGSGRQQLG